MNLNPATNRAAFWQMARAMASWSRRAYCETTVAEPTTSTSALVQLDAEGDIIVAFKGSQEPKDFLQDAEFWRVPLIWSKAMSAEVHHGFLENFNAIDADLVGSVRGLLALHPTAQIFITGHSLGGALAILCALEFARQQLPVAGVFTFGQPRVGNAAFAELYDITAVAGETPATLRDLTFRIVNQNDIVPRTPGALIGYRHCGTEIFLEPPPAFGFQVEPDLFYKLLADAFGLWVAYRKKCDVLITEHFIHAYQDRIKNL